MRFALLPEGRAVSLVFPRDSRRYSRHWPEWFVGLIVSRARTLSRDSALRPLSVDFQHGPPSDLTTLTSVLGCLPTFSKPTTGVTFSHEVLARPIPEASAALGRIIATQAERDLRDSSPGDQVGTQIKRRLMELLEREVPRIGTVARQAGCSVRTLQARLRKEGTSYEKLLDEARRQLAIQYVEDHSIRLMEIPLLLQFAEPSPFHRAFRRWTGTTPLEYRRSRWPESRPAAAPGGGADSLPSAL